MKTFLTNFKRMINARTLLCVIAVTLLCFFSHDPMSNSYETPPTLIELTAKAFGGETGIYTREDILRYFDSSFWFYIVLPVIVSMPAVSDFYDEWFNNGAYYFNVHRQQIPKYCVAKSFAYALNAAIIFLVGFAVFAAPVYFAFPALDAESLAMSFPDGFFAFFAGRVLNVAAVSAVCPLVTILVLILIKEKFLALSFPMLVNYLTSQIGGFLSVRAYTENKPYLQKIYALLPTSQFTQSLNFEGTFGAPLFVWYIAWVLIFVLCGAGLFLLVKRRVRSGG